uniref:arylsulfatase-like n=1 Tax=Styela clava TaxID=7725 RepID=UPI00193A40BA|nr:arylsulfatase-like [Styela clava]
MSVAVSLYFILTNNYNESQEQPNIIIMYADDTGYADFQTYGHPTQEWNGVDRMAQEGIKFTQLSTPSPICTPSRAALLTGRYPIRTGVFGKNGVFLPSSSGGLPNREITIAKALRDVGYVTGMVGKWHLGINKNSSTDGYYLPHNHGFDYVGTILPHTVSDTCNPEKYNVRQMRSCFLYRNDTIVEQPINLTTLTKRLVVDAKHFIDTNKNNPFFFLFSFPQTHTALFASPEFLGKSKRGIYGDMVNEMGSSINEIMDQLIDLKMEKRTLVIFLSDHGPKLDGCGDGGSPGVFRGGKTSTWEGGIRVPAVAWWPGTIKPGIVSDAVLSSLDIFPTVLKIAGSNYIERHNLTIDGHVNDEVIKGLKSESNDETLFFYHSGVLTAARHQQYKIHFYKFRLAVDIMEKLDEMIRCDYTSSTVQDAIYDMETKASKQDIPLIYDIEKDPQESFPLDPESEEYQKVLKLVVQQVQAHNASILAVESEIDKPYTNDAPCCNPPLCKCNYNEE